MIDKMLHDPTFWVAIGFIILMVLIGRKLFAGITGGLDRRAEAIRAEIEQAHALNDEAKQLLSTYQRKLREAAKEAEEIQAHAAEEAQRLRREAEERLEASMARREQAALDKIAQAEVQALQQVRDTAIDVAIAAATEVIAGKLDDGTASGLIDETIKELPARLQ